MITIGRGIFALILIMSAFSGIGVYHVLMAKGLLSVSIPYEAQGYMDYSIAPKQEGKRR